MIKDDESRSSSNKSVAYCNCNAINESFLRIRYLYDEYLFKEKFNSRAIDSIQNDLEKLCGLEKELIDMKHKLNGIQEIKYELDRLKDVIYQMENKSIFLNCLIIILPIFLMVALLI